ncbi:uncharacterized protein Bfra_004467 [Botrytis fragariae]|uniref:Uncharacterized protein n=1 Tax=Botrytis fragariae TaxID=1964551 RepID=A0A8H6EJE3_9HELO|nr:uncharacterized protein Bfra_004467 [Botrytis fragariae]KAF5874458.1 hypothetical protein Bfra_004467 [Botrytis fragariae]
MQEMPLARLAVANVNLCFRLKATAAQGEEVLFFFFFFNHMTSVSFLQDLKKTLSKSKKTLQI